MENRVQVNSKVWEIAPIAAIALSRSVRAIILGGFQYWRWWETIWLVLGWMIGWLLAEIDDYFYVFVSNPQELTSQRCKQYLAAKNYKAAWNLLQSTREERTARMPVRNMLTLMVVMAVGVWIVTSNGSPMGSGVVLGLGTRMFSEFVMEKDKKKWFWIFSREFSVNERWVITVGCVVALVWQAMMTIRG